ncbi:MAG TPA: hypothetical protein VF743_13405, partial [Acidimicrobiales bacterium]
LRTLARIVEQAPPTLDVVMAARADPPLGWGRLRLQGRLRQVRNDDLRFRPDEAAELFAGHGVRIGRDDTRVLCDRTEGWAAGLRLAACALQSDAEPGRLVLSASATQVAVSDYLLTEVLDRQDEAAQRFLLRTSVVDRLTPDLARALTGDARAGERLAALERRGIFLVQLEEDGSYRYHALFAALLRARLRLRDPELVAALHRRAAGWHLAHGLPVEAEFHARAAGEWYMVGRLVLDRWLAAAVDARPLAGGATDGVPPVVTMGTPELALVAAAQACRHRNRRDADRYRHVVDRVSATAPDRVSSWSTARDVLDVEYGRAFGAGARELHAARRLADDPRAGVLTPRARRLGDLRHAELDLDGGRVERAQQALGHLVDDPAAGPVRTEAAAVLSVVGATAGDLGTAQALASTVLAAAAADAPDQGSVEATDAARLALALCHLQRAEHRLAGDVLDGMAGGTLPCRSIEAVHRAVTAARQRRSSGPVVLDVPGAEDPLLGAALSALGVVEIADTKGRPRLHGGQGENLLAA